MPVIARSVSLPAAVALMIARAAGLLAPFGLLGLPVAALLLIVSARSIARREHEASAAACTPFAELAAAVRTGRRRRSARPCRRRSRWRGR